MGTDQLLDLFSLDTRQSTASTSRGADQSEQPKSGMKGMLESLSELWDEKQYEQEFDLGSFMQTLAK